MFKSLSLKIENKIAVIEFDQPDSKVNVLSEASLTELEQIISQIRAMPNLSGVCIYSKKTDIFIAGADIREIEKITSVDEARAKAKAGQKILNALEELSFPTVALINGACLGAGLELALACDYRLVCFGPKVKLGLPEVKLGLIPGFGGTKRLPRLVGLRKGLEMVLSGEAVSGNEALKIGLVDSLVSQNRLLEEAKEFLKAHPKKRKAHKPRLKGLINILLDKTFMGRLILKSQTQKLVLKTTRGHYPAPLKAVEIVVRNYGSSLRSSLEQEAKAFAELAVGEISKNLIRVFYLVEKYKKAKWVEAKPRQIYKCGLLGAGVMGGGIAQLLSFYGITVRMKDLNYEALGRGLKQAKEVYDYAVKKKKIRPNQALLGMGLISPTIDYSGFSNVDLIIEAVVEDMNLKKAVWQEIDSLTKPDAIFVSNTSCLSIAQMSEGIKNKNRVAGMHFFNPVHRMPLVEIIRTSQTSDETIATIVEFSKRVGKTPIVVKDTSGFLVNRILLPYLNEAGFMVDEGINFERIDEICLDFGLPMGAFTLVDEIGLDVGYKVALILEEYFGERMKVADILKKVYAQKWFGKKTGKGFYIHKGKNKQPNKEIYNLINIEKSLLNADTRKSNADKRRFYPRPSACPANSINCWAGSRPIGYNYRRDNPRKSALKDEEILERMLYRMINEAGLCLEEKVASEPSDVDIGMIMGTGFPPFRAGLLHYADSIGLEKIVASLEQFKAKFSAQRFEPCKYLVNLAERKLGFYTSDTVT